MSMWTVNKRMQQRSEAAAYMQGTCHDKLLAVICIDPSLGQKEFACEGVDRPPVMWL